MHRVKVVALSRDGNSVSGNVSCFKHGTLVNEDVICWGLDADGRDCCIYNNFTVEVATKPLD
jgi:hypothetical protein